VTPQNRNPERLCPCIRGLYFGLLDSAQDAGIEVATIETIRAKDRQEHYVKVGASWTMRSKHLPQPPNQLALAFDIAPKDYLTIPGWAPKGEHWQTLGRLGKKLGLVWGGDWTKARDYPHFQLERCNCDD
jgi:peptidoglycan L-alanyl-D-glutamate endopeptidase CwlK